MSIWSLTYQQSVFKHYQSGKHFSEFYLQDGGKKSTGTHVEQNDVSHPMYRQTFTVTRHDNAQNGGK